MPSPRFKKNARGDLVTTVVIKDTFTKSELDRIRRTLGTDDPIAMIRQCYSTGLNIMYEQINELEEAPEEN